EIRAELAGARHELIDRLRDLRAACARLRAEGAANPLHEAVTGPGSGHGDPIGEKELLGLLAQPSEAARWAAAEAMLDGPAGPRVIAVAEQMAALIAKHTIAASAACGRVLAPDAEDAPSRSAAAAAARA